MMIPGTPRNHMRMGTTWFSFRFQESAAEQRSHPNRAGEPVTAGQSSLASKVSPDSRLVAPRLFQTRGAWSACPSGPRIIATPLRGIGAPECAPRLQCVPRSSRLPRITAPATKMRVPASVMMMIANANARRSGVLSCIPTIVLRAMPAGTRLPRAIVPRNRVTNAKKISVMARTLGSSEFPQCWVAIHSFVLLAVSLYVGAYVLSFFGISMPVLRVGGGIVIATAAWRILNAAEDAKPVVDSGELLSLIQALARNT